jgi:Phosphotransferase enzyme family
MDDATLRAICGLFDLGTPPAHAEPVLGGLTNRLWRVATDGGVFAVKEMNRDTARADYVAWFDRAFSLEAAAFRAGIPVPRPVPVAATGRCLGEVRRPGEPPMTVRAHEWIEGVALQGGVVYPPDIISRVAEVIAGIHRLRMASDVRPSEALRVYGDEHWRAFAERASVERADWAPDLAALLPPLHELEAYLQAAHEDPTPLLVSHRDADQKNFMRSSAGELLLVDWDAAGPVNPRHDLANEALVWAGVHRIDPDEATARAFVAAYRKAGGVDDAFRATDIAELVSLRLGWLDFNVRRALGERLRDASDRDAGVRVIRTNVEQLSRFVRSLDTWIAVLGE